jgi:hypothetical protein
MKVRTNLLAGQQGLGDTIADFTHKTGLDQLAKGYEETTGKSCGCQQRQQQLNQLFPYAPQTA